MDNTPASAELEDSTDDTLHVVSAILPQVGYCQISKRARSLQQASACLPAQSPAPPGIVLMPYCIMCTLAGMFKCIAVSLIWSVGVPDYIHAAASD